MLTEDRYEYIIENINRNNSVKLKDLVDILGTSESTVRRDLDELEARGLLKRVRGGAISSSNFTQDISINTRKQENTDSKIALGRYCASLVEDGDCLYLDAGTTTNEIIPFLKGKDIVIVTNGIYNIDRLVENKIRSYIIGGSIKPMTNTIVGEMAVENLSHYRFTIAFIGANGISYNSSITTPDVSEAAVKKKAIQLSKRPYVVADSSKFDKVSFSEICRLEDVSIITNVSEAEIDPRIVEASEIITI